MYSVPIIGAVVVGMNGEMLGVVESIEHTKEGVHVVMWDGEDIDDGAKDDIPERPSGEALGKLRAVASGDKI